MNTVISRSSKFPKNSPGLLFASVVIGGLAGAAGYLVGGYFYALFLFPFILLAMAGILYVPTSRFLGSSSRVFSALCGLLMGLSLFAGFHYTEYSAFRSAIIARIQAAQVLDEDAASISLDAYLRENTGLGGLLGFMKYQQDQWRPYVYYFVQDGKITSAPDLVLQGKKAWLYLAGEAAVLMGGGALLGFLGASRYPPWKLNNVAPN